MKFTRRFFCCLPRSNRWNKTGGRGTRRVGSFGYTNGTGNERLGQTPFSCAERTLPGAPSGRWALRQQVASAKLTEGECVMILLWKYYLVKPNVTHSPSTAYAVPHKVMRSITLTPYRRRLLLGVSSVYRGEVLLNRLLLRLIVQSKRSDPKGRPAPQAAWVSTSFAVELVCKYYSAKLLRLCLISSLTRALTSLKMTVKFVCAVRNDSEVCQLRLL